MLPQDDRNANAGVPIRKSEHHRDRAGATALPPRSVTQHRWYLSD